MVKSFLLSHNNPFALRRTRSNWLGKVASSDSFERFDILEHGVRAGLINLLTQMRKHKSLKNLIYAYAPPFENNSDSYYNFVRLRVINDYRTLLTQEIHFIDLARAIVRFECGQECPMSITQVLFKYHIFEKHLILLSRTQK